MAFEEEVLSVGADYLPECAVAVRDGGEPTTEYWQWLISQAEVRGTPPAYRGWRCR